MPLRPLLLVIVAIAGLILLGVALSGLPRSFAAERPWVVPDWLQVHVGEGEGQIAPVILQRGRALYLKKVSEGAVNNPCFGMDATRPGGLGRRLMSSTKPTGCLARYRPAMAAVATLKASRISQTAFAAQRTSAMRWIPS